MKCPKCGADSSVRSTRPYKELFTKRGLECFNNHRFVSYEVTAACLDRRALESVKRGIARSTVAEHRRRYVLERPELSNLQLAVRLKITSSRVKQIRAENEGA